MSKALWTSIEAQEDTLASKATCSWAKALELKLVRIQANAKTDKKKLLFVRIINTPGQYSMFLISQLKTREGRAIRHASNLLDLLTASRFPHPATKTPGRQVATTLEAPPLLAALRGFAAYWYVPALNRPLDFILLYYIWPMETKPDMIFKNSIK